MRALGDFTKLLWVCGILARPGDSRGAKLVADNSTPTHAGQRFDFAVIPRRDRAGRVHAVETWAPQDNVPRWKWGTTGVNECNRDFATASWERTFHRLELTIAPSSDLGWANRLTNAFGVALTR